MRAPSSDNPMPKVVQAKLFDWTYTTTYCGHISGEIPNVPTEVPSLLFSLEANW